MSNPKEHIFILGPTATGKTRLAAETALLAGAEIISADSRQIYRNMDLGTGKDLEEYTVRGTDIPYHLINITEAGTRYSVFDYTRDFTEAVGTILSKHKRVLVCGGSGMYLEAALGLYQLTESPEDESFRRQASSLSLEELTGMLRELRPLHNTTDTTERERLIRAIEIARAENNSKIRVINQEPAVVRPDNSLIIGITLPRQQIRQRITERLTTRLNQGMLNEVSELLNKGIKPEDLTYYGLEYRYLTLYLTGKISYDEMFSQLNTAIHQFAKRQMTWFRRMEKKGIDIQWIDGNTPPEQNALLIAGMFKLSEN
ncbi:MAG: tRNA (adenosine(37)-N6)-dimethylallyltransferase MiaA [Bacteroidales bacterium]|nr:tRNA (adenosine(37)-N6)-dimethylallyltransferase MiaA [Bacteroidales bacterium]